MELDEEVEPEVLEWLMGLPINEPVDVMLMKKRIESAPPLDGNPRPRKTLLLLRLEAKINSGHICEEVLDHLEIIERLDRSQCLRTTNSMIRAYCAVALECTVKYLAGNLERNGKYLDAVNRIWRGRIENLENSKESRLVKSEELRSRRRQVEAAVEDEEVANVLIGANTFVEALRTLKAYLREALAMMGISSLERECDYFLSRRYKSGILVVEAD